MRLFQQSVSSEQVHPEYELPWTTLVPIMEQNMSIKTEKRLSTGMVQENMLSSYPTTQKVSLVVTGNICRKQELAYLLIEALFEGSIPILLGRLCWGELPDQRGWRGQSSPSPSRRRRLHPTPDIRIELILLVSLSLCFVLLVRILSPHAEPLYKYSLFKGNLVPIRQRVLVCVAFVF